jgi:hypothetical protein
MLLIEFHLLQTNARCPDFKYRATHEALWLDGQMESHMVEANLTALAPGTVQTKQWDVKSTRDAKSRQYEKIIELFEKIQ